MKISLEWLSEFITWTEKDPHVIADKITLSTAEVEEVEMQGALLDHCVVGEILSVKKHPDADRLCIAEVKTDKGTKTVVCGGTNVKEGMIVAFAHVGATVKWHGGEMVKLEPVKIRGVASEGMVCAAEELGLESMLPPQAEDGERPIMDLSRLEAKSYKLKAGQSLRETLGLHDTILHVNNTAITTRPDLFSHLGFARECVAIGLAKWKKQPTFKLPKFPAKKGPITMRVDDTKAAPRYLSTHIHIDGLGETPDWMRRRLEATGWRCVNLPVDITNYVAMEIGVPLHSFDAGDITGDVHLRRSKKGEKITTLDGVERQLPDGALILSDDEGIFDLLGIMGGLRSSTKESTKTIYLHAASLDPASIRKAIIGTGHRTDAGTVYEKGVPPITSEQGFIRALQLMLQLIPGANIVSSLENKGENGKPKPILVSVSTIQKTLGIDIPEKEIVKILESLECKVQIKKDSTKANNLSVTPPLHRLRDLQGPHDIVEEVGRIHGFDTVPFTMPTAPVQLPAHETRAHRMRDTLEGSGYWELVPLSLIGPNLLQKCNLSIENAVAIANPLGEEMSLLHTSALPALLEHAEKFLPLVDHDLMTFQTARVFAKGKSEHLEMSILLAAKEETDVLHDPFLRLKRDLLHAANEAGYDLTVSEAKDVPSYAHPGRSAQIQIGTTVIGTISEIHPIVRKRFDLPFRAASATINLSLLFSEKPITKKAKPIPQFPSVTYDVTLRRTQDQALHSLLQKLRSASKLLETISVQDLYAGKPLTGNEYNLTLRFVYRSPERTLTEEEVKKEHEIVLKAAGLNAI